MDKDARVGYVEREQAIDRLQHHCSRNASGQRLPAPCYAVMTGYAGTRAGPRIAPAWGLAGGIAATLVIGELVAPCRRARCTIAAPKACRSPPWLHASRMR
jgi:hypothetical protein